MREKLPLPQVFMISRMESSWYNAFTLTGGWKRVMNAGHQDNMKKSPDNSNQCKENGDDQAGTSLPILDIVECLLLDGAHILISPLVPITGYGSYLQSKLDSMPASQIREFVDTIVESSVEATDRIRMILLGLECRYGKHKFEDVPCDLYEDIIGPLIVDLAGEGFPPVEFQTPSQPLTVRGNRALLRDAIRLLIKFINYSQKLSGPGKIIMELSYSKLKLKGRPDFDGDADLAACYSWIGEVRETCINHPSQALALSIAGQVLMTQHAIFTIDMENDSFTITFGEQ